MLQYTLLTFCCTSASEITFTKLKGSKETRSLRISTAFVLTSALFSALFAAFSRFHAQGYVTFLLSGSSEHRGTECCSNGSLFSTGIRGPLWIICCSYGSQVHWHPRAVVDRVYSCFSRLESWSSVRHRPLIKLSTTEGHLVISWPCFARYLFKFIVKNQDGRFVFSWLHFAPMF